MPAIPLKTPGYGWDIDQAMVIRGAGMGDWRVDTGIEIEGTDAGLSLFQLDNPGGATHEAFIAFGGYDSAGVRQKTTSISSKFVDANTNTGFGITRINTTYSNGAGAFTDEVSIRAFGKHGVTIFGNNDSDYPGDKTLLIRGSLFFRDDFALVGYASGAGGAVTQASSKANTVTLDKPCGEITMNGAALAANTTVSFALQSNKILGAGQLLVTHKSGGTMGAYAFSALTSNGAATIYVRNITGGSLSEAIVIQFTQIISANA